MSETNDDVKMLSRAVLNNARGDAEQNLKEAREKAAAIRKNAEEQAAAERARILQKAQAEADRVRGQVVASTQLKARTLQLDQREEMLASVFQTAHQQLATVQKSTDYQKTVEGLLREALTQLGVEQAVIHADAVTQKLLGDGLLEKVARDMKVKAKLGEPLKQGTGLIVETEDGRRQYDNTLETRLGRLQDTLRSPVYHLLMGEAL
jgi:V/A-type H+-transporting ATPase subunit E